VLCELMNDDGSMRRGDALLAFSRTHGYPMLSIEELVAFRREQEAVSA
jgi:3,4-dihydroxy-2-butanone 4-phosphate synthase